MIKKSLIIFTVAIAFVAVYLASCQKDNVLTEKQEISLSDDQKMEQQIIQFKTQLSDSKKSGEIMELNSAIWYIDAVLNYSYTFPFIEYYNYSSSNTLVTMDISDDNVAFSELVETYNEIEDIVRNHFFSIENENKHLVTISLVVTENSTDNIIEFKVVSEVGLYNTEKSADIINDNPFGSTDYWYYGNELGKCGSYSGSEGWDAAKKIASKVKSTLLHHSFMYYFTDEYWPPLPIMPNDLPSNLELYHMGDDCLSPNEMNYHYNEMLEIVDHFSPGGGKTFKTCILKGTFILGKGPYCHYVDDLIYGIKHKREAVPENPCTFP
ncbi:MAG: hypothetical protein KAT68_04955 [Bacteroidales bacterium]|nr:hypothetical protein [Bacteroidales bacterium]